MFKRIFDIVLAGGAIIILAPVFVGAYVFVKFSSSGTVIYKQKRIGQFEKPFQLLKFRTMVVGAASEGKLTIGDDDRVTSTGRFLRKWKIDELPQLWNVIRGDMSIVGPRPEVPEYVAKYKDRYKNVLKVKPGITDYASVKFFNENEILQQYSDPVKAYIEIILPEKLDLNEQYVQNKNLLTDIYIIGLTFQRFIYQSRNK